MTRVAFKIFLLLVTFLSGTRSGCASDAPLEYQVKALCVLNAARFVTWPQGAFNDPSAPIVIGILGENPFGQALQLATRDQTVQQRRILLRPVSLEEAVDCHVVFIGRSEKDRMESILNALGQSAVLTISEIERFASMGGMIGLTLENGKVRFEINPEAARRKRLKIDPRLLSLARIVK